jgi:trans-aconitate 2-methyltransferase
MARNWDGTTYDRISEPMQRLGLAVLDRLQLRGGETVIDAGCGSGRVTEALCDRLPDGRVIGVDGAPGMIAAARERLGDRAELHVQDLTALDLGVQADAILSTATFHWIPDHPGLFARLRAHTRPGGRLVAQCGGGDNVAGIRAVVDAVGARKPFAEFLAGWAGPWRFASPEDAEADLRGAGFTDVRTWLEERPVVTGEPAHWMRTIFLGSHLERLPEDLRDAYIDAVVAEFPDPMTLDYVRLNIDATAA